jgi:hypothetical protein
MVPLDAVAIAALAPCLVGLACVIAVIRARREDIPAVVAALAQAFRKPRRLLR